MATILDQLKPRSLRHNDPSRMSLCFQGKDKERFSQPHAGIAMFTHLPQLAMSIVARELVREHQHTGDVFDLLPWRLLARRFTGVITHWIFHSPKVLMNQLYVDVRTAPGEPPWTMRRHFLNTMTFPWAQNSVRDLTCMTRLAKGDYPVKAMHNNLLVLRNTGRTIRRLHLDADVRDSVLTDTILPRLLPKTFENLQVLVLNAAFLSLLVSLLDNAPRLHSVCLQGGRHLPFSIKDADDILAQNEDYQRRPGRAALPVLQMDDIRYMDFEGFLQKSRLRAKHVKLRLLSLGELQSFLKTQVIAGIQNWPLFQKCEKITLLNPDLETGRLEIPQPLVQNVLAESLKSRSK